VNSCYALTAKRMKTPAKPIAMSQIFEHKISLAASSDSNTIHQKSALLLL